MLSLVAKAVVVVGSQMKQDLSKIGISSSFSSRLILA